MRRPRSSSIRLRLQSHRAKLSCSTTATSSSAVAGSTETLHHGKTLHHGGHGGQEVEPDGFSPPCPPCPLWWRVQTVATGRVFASVSPVSTVVESSDRDRKSTRLNSSHLVISYAVFCLKKKKKTDEHTIPCILYYRLMS